MEAVRTSETSVDNHFTRQYIPEDNPEHLFIVCITEGFEYDYLQEYCSLYRRSRGVYIIVKQTINKIPCSNFHLVGEEDGGGDVIKMCRSVPGRAG
jgi:hypothetical protein